MPLAAQAYRAVALHRLAWANSWCALLGLGVNAIDQKTVQGYKAVMKAIMPVLAVFSTITLLVHAEAPTAD
ncbi:MAG: hypothetical protein ACLQU3_02830 [Limisphaerales bacterium]